MVFIILLFPLLVFSSDFTTIPKQTEKTIDNEYSFEKDFSNINSSYQKSMETYSNCMSSVQTKEDVNKCNYERRERNTFLNQQKQNIRNAMTIKRKQEQLKATVDALKNGEIKVEKAPQ